METLQKEHDLPLPPADKVLFPETGAKRIRRNPRGN